MSDPGRPINRDRARGRSSHTSERRDDRDKSRGSSSQHGPGDSYGSRRPGEPSQPGAYSAPYPRPSTSSSVSRESYPVLISAKGFLCSNLFIK